MKVTYENIEDLPINNKDKVILKSLLTDIDEINNANLKDPIYIDWEENHTEYSPEWTEPCPDFYGTYSLIRSTTKDKLGVEMDIDTLDIALCLLNNYIIYE